MRALRGELTDRAREQKRELHVDRSITGADQHLTGTQRRSGKAGSRSGSVPRSAMSSDMSGDTAEASSSTWSNEVSSPEALSRLNRRFEGASPVEILESSAEDTS